MLHYYHSLFPPYFEWWNIPLLFFADLIGESFGSLVGGGSIVSMPALLLTGMPLQAAIATDNGAALGCEAGILTETHQKVMANKKMVVLMAVPLTLGGIVGTWLLFNVPGLAIKYFMAAAVTFIVVYAYFGRKPNSKSVNKSSYALIVAILFLIGIYSNFMTAGAGAFSRIALMSILGWSFLQSQGINAVAIMPSRIYSLIITGIAGLIVWPYLLTMWCASFIAGKYVTRFAKHVPDSYMKALLTIVSLLFVVYLLFFYGH